MTEKFKKVIQVNNISLVITILLFLSLSSFGAIKYDNFLSLSTFLNLINDNAYLIIAAVGVTFVLLTGGIDISVASTIAFTGMLTAFLLEKGVPVGIVLVIVLTIGTILGIAMGAIIHYFDLQPFIVTLAGQFLMRGLCVVISKESIPIANPVFLQMAMGKIKFGKGKLYFYSLIAVSLVAGAYYILKYAKIGRSIYALGGGEQSAILMGLPVAKTKITVYGVSSFCAALGGIVFSFYTMAASPLQNMGLELDAISAAVIGGTLLSGGVGTVIGTVFGVLIQGVIQQIVIFQNLNTWWTKVTIAGLLCVFIIIQRAISVFADKAKGKSL